MANRRALCLTATAARRAEDDGFMSGADGGSPAAADDPVFGDQIAPLRRENQHLLGVNNSLQVRLIEATEARDEAVGALESKNSKLRDQLSSVTFMLKSRAASLADKEKENELMREQLKRLRAIMLRGSKADAAPVLALARRAPPPAPVAAGAARAEASQKGLSERGAGVAGPGPSGEVLGALQSRVAVLEGEVRRARTAEAEAVRTKAELEERVRVRDDELRRLAALVESERRWDRVTAEGALADRDFEIKKLNDQIAFLNNCKSEMGEELEAVRQKVEIVERNEDELVALRTRNEELVTSFARATGEIKDLLSHLQEEGDRHRNTVEKLHQELQQKDRAAEAVQAEAKGLNDKLAEVSQKYARALDTIAQQDATMSRSQRDMQRFGERKLREDAETEVLGRERAIFEQRAQQYKREMIAVQEQFATARKEWVRRETELSEGLQRVRGDCNRLGRKLEVTETERDNLLRENTRLQIQCAKVTTLEETESKLEAGLNDVGREAKQLRAALELKEREVKQFRRIESQLRGQCAAKDGDCRKLAAQLRASQQGVRAIRDQVEALALEREREQTEYASRERELLARLRLSADLVGQGDDAKAKLRGAEAVAQKREELVAQLQKKLAEQQDAAAEWQRRCADEEKRRGALEARLSDTQSSMAERQMTSVLTLRQTRSERETLESQLSEKQARLAAEAKARRALEQKLGDMDQLIRQNSAMRTSMERQVVVHTGRVDELQRAVRELESERDEVAERARQSGDEISRLKAMVQELDRERDRVQEVADSKEEELAQLRESANAERKTRSGSDAKVQLLTNKLQAVVTDLNAKEQVVRNLKIRLTEREQAMLECEERLKVYKQELETRVADLNNLTKENQLLNQQVRQISSHNKQIAGKFGQTLTSEKILEQKLIGKQRELRDVLSSYKAACLENQRLKLGAEEFEQLRSRLAIGLQAARQQNSQLKMQMQANRRYQKRLLTEIKGYEAERERLTRALKLKTEEVYKLNQERQLLEVEVSGSRGSTLHLRQAQLQFQGKLAAKNDDVRRAEERAARAQLEVVALKEAVAKKKREVSSLEAVIAANREQKHQLEVQLKQTSASTAESASGFQTERNRLQAVNEAVQRELRAKNMQLARQQNVVSELTSHLSSFVELTNGDQAQDDVKLGNLRNVAKAAIATVAVDSAAGDDSGPRQDSDTSVEETVDSFSAQMQGLDDAVTRAENQAAR